jgi:hypothetical protein
MHALEKIIELNVLEKIIEQPAKSSKKKTYKITPTFQYGTDNFHYLLPPFWYIHLLY